MSPPWTARRYIAPSSTPSPPSTLKRRRAPRRLRRGPASGSASPQTLRRSRRLRTSTPRPPRPPQTTPAPLHVCPHSLPRGLPAATQCRLRDAVQGPCMSSVWLVGCTYGLHARLHATLYACRSRQAGRVGKPDATHHHTRPSHPIQDHRALRRLLCCSATSGRRACAHQHPVRTLTPSTHQ